MAVKTKRVLLGLARNRYWLGYLHSVQGRRVKPLVPRLIQRAIVGIWNSIACALFGHDESLKGVRELERNGNFQCCQCCKWLEVGQ